MSKIAIPALGKTESVAVIAVGILVAYVLYRVYTTGSALKGTITDGVSNAASAVTDLFKLGADGASIALDKARTTSVGASPAAPGDQSDAETARLNAQAGLGVSYQSPYDPFTNATPVLGQARSIEAYPQIDSPDASGLSVWSVLP